MRSSNFIQQHLFLIPQLLPPARIVSGSVRNKLIRNNTQNQPSPGYIRVLLHSIHSFSHGFRTGASVHA